MAAATSYMFTGTRRVAVNVKGTGTDETDTVIIDKSALTGPAGAEPSKLIIEEIWWTINGYNYVLLEFDRGTDVVIDYFAGQGYMDFKPWGGKVDTGSGGTGDLILTSQGSASANTNFSFVIAARLKA